MQSDKHYVNALKKYPKVLNLTILLILILSVTVLRSLKSSVGWLPISPLLRRQVEEAKALPDGQTAFPAAKTLL